MDKEKITTMALGEGLDQCETDWERLRNMKDEDIDCSDIPPLDAEWFATAKIVKPPGAETEDEHNALAELEEQLLDRLNDARKNGVSKRTAKEIFEAGYRKYGQVDD